MPQEGHGLGIEPESLTKGDLADVDRVYVDAFFLVIVYSAA